MKYTVFNTIYFGVLSNNAKIILKKIQHRSYYRALDLLVFIPDLVQRNFILQVLCSVSSYLQNNYDIDLMELRIDSINIKKDQKTNDFMKLYKTAHYLPFSYHITIKLEILEIEE